MLQSRLRLYHAMYAVTASFLPKGAELQFVWHAHFASLLIPYQAELAIPTPVNDDPIHPRRHKGGGDATPHELFF